SCWSLPALRQVKTAFLMWSPVAQANISLGEALLTFMTAWKSCMLTLPAPPPPPEECVPDWDWPQLHDSRSIEPLCLPSVDSPSPPPIFRKKSTDAICHSFRVVKAAACSIATGDLAGDDRSDQVRTYHGAGQPAPGSSLAPFGRPPCRASNELNPGRPAN